jgi:hypothetical protein
MIVFENCVISDEIVTKKFVCDLSKCKGACCIHGDTGAPLHEEELSILDDIFEDIKEFLPEESARAIEKQGKYTIDVHGEYVTTLVDGKQCAYVFTDENGIAKCAIEKAFNEGIISFRKPISCFLYPIRVSKYNSYDAVNYHQWEICKDARILGDKLNVSVSQFLKEPIIQRFGKDLYEALKRVKI